jgi:hypothetical protein
MTWSFVLIESGVSATILSFNTTGRLNPITLHHGSDSPRGSVNVQRSSFPNFSHQQLMRGLQHLSLYVTLSITYLLKHDLADRRFRMGCHGYPLLSSGAKLWVHISEPRLQGSMCAACCLYVHFSNRCSVGIVLSFLFIVMYHTECSEHYVRATSGLFTACNMSAVFWNNFCCPFYIWLHGHNQRKTQARVLPTKSFGGPS